jgi:hypothetical protein
LERFVGAAPERFERLFVEAAGGDVDLADAVYPPACDPPGGPVRFRPVAAGGLVVEVEPRRLRSDDFRLALLFSRGACLFPDAASLASFWNGPLAAAFGIVVPPPPPPPVPAPVELGLAGDVRPPGRVGAGRRGRRHPRPSSARAPDPAELAMLLSERTHGQDDALEVLADVVATQLAKTAPARPASVALIGQTGTGKTSTLEALPAALAELGRPRAHLFRRPG